MSTPLTHPLEADLRSAADARRMQYPLMMCVCGVFLNAKDDFPRPLHAQRVVYVIGRF